MNNPHATFQIGLKVLLKKDDLVLVLKDAITGHYDFAGGRMNENEKKLPLKDILAREVLEELGSSIQYKLGSPLFQYRRNNIHNPMHVFITVYGAEYISGEIELSEEHSSYEWVNPNDDSFDITNFGNEEEASAVKAYFKTLQS
jgi:8-oxo-dGTP pyrophosphatase MutT (NUDIX family)